MKKLLITLLCALSAVSGYARQRVPARDIVIDQTPVYHILTNEEEMQQVTVTFDNAVYSNLTNANDMADMINSNTLNIVAISNTLVDVEGRVSTNEVNISSNTECRIAFTALTNRICTVDTVINVDPGMSEDEIIALGSTYDTMRKGVSLTYLFAQGTYNFSRSFMLNDMIVPGGGMTIIKGTYTTVDHPETILNFSTSGNCGVVLDNHFRNEDSSSSYTAVLIEGFTIRGPTPIAGVSTDYGLAVRNSTLVVRPPLRIEAFENVGIFATSFGYTYVIPVIDGGSSITPVYIESRTGTSDKFFGVFASAMSIVGVSEKDTSVGDNWCVFEGGDNYRAFIHAYNFGGVYCNHLGIDITSASTAAGEADLAVSSFGVISIHDETNYTHYVTSETLNGEIH